MSALEDFAAFCERLLVLDNGQAMVLEPFQRTMLADYFQGARETLCLLPKGNYKSTTIAALALFELVTTVDSEIIIAAAARDQGADIILRQTAGFIRRNPELDSRLTLKQREIERVDRRGRIRVLTSDADTGDGSIPTRVFVDELHRWKSFALYATLHGALNKRNARLVSITTAGAGQDSPLWQARQRALEMGSRRDGAYLRAGSDAFVLHEWSLEPDADPDDLTAVKRANPASTMTVELLAERHESPMMTSWDWQRFTCCLWTSADEPWLSPGEWDGCRSHLRIPDDATVVAGVDIGRKRDTSAVAVVANVEGRIVVRAFVFQSPGRGSDESGDLGRIEECLRELARPYELVEVAYDPWSFTRSAQLLSDEGLPMVEYPQSHSRMAPASARLLDAIRSRRIAHDGDPVLASQVLAGAVTDTPRGWRLTKRKARSPIDALIALTMAVDRLDSHDGDNDIPELLVSWR